MNFQLIRAISLRVVNMFKALEKNRVKFSVDILSLADLIYPILHEHAFGLDNAINYKHLIPLIRRVLADFTITNRDIRKACKALLKVRCLPVVSGGNKGIFVAENQSEIDRFVANQIGYATECFENARAAKFCSPEKKLVENGYFEFA